MVAKDQGKPPWGTDSKALTSSLIRPAHPAYISTRYTVSQGGENGGGRVCVPFFLLKQFLWQCKPLLLTHPHRHRSGEKGAKLSPDCRQRQDSDTTATHSVCVVRWAPGPAWHPSEQLKRNHARDQVRPSARALTPPTTARLVSEHRRGLSSVESIFLQNNK